MDCGRRRPKMKQRQARMFDILPHSTPFCSSILCKSVLTIHSEGQKKKHATRIYGLECEEDADFHLKSQKRKMVPCASGCSLCPDISLRPRDAVLSSHILRILEKITHISETLDPLQQRHIQLIPPIIEWHPMVRPLEMPDCQPPLGVLFECWLVQATNTNGVKLARTIEDGNVDRVG